MKKFVAAIGILAVLSAFSACVPTRAENTMNTGIIDEAAPAGEEKKEKSSGQALEGIQQDLSELDKLLEDEEFMGIDDF